MNFIKSMLKMVPIKSIGGLWIGTNSENSYLLKLWSQNCFNKAGQGKSYWRGRLSTFQLLVLTSLDQLLFYKLYLPFYNITYLNEEVNCTELSQSVSIPWYCIYLIVNKSRGDESPKIFTHTLWCYIYTRPNSIAMNLMYEFH